MNMKFENAFEVPLSVDQTWDLLLDIEALAPCFPGARLTEVLDPRTFHGEVSVRLGPGSSSYCAPSWRNRAVRFFVNSAMI